MDETTPNEITPFIREFCREIDPTQTPVYVPVQPDQGAEPGMCFPAVNRKIQREGGSIQHGWIIWEWPPFMLDAEFHAVWVTPDGHYVDMVPKPDGETRILFLPDSQRTWQQQCVPNKRKPFRTDPVMDEYLAVLNEIDELSVRHCNPDGTRAVSLGLLLPLEMRKRALSQRLGMPILLPTPSQMKLVTKHLNPRERAEQRKKQRRKNRRQK